MELNAWTKTLRAVYDRTLTRMQQGENDLNSLFSPEDVAFLASIGLKPIHVYDFAEDFIGDGELDWDTFLLVVAARRDYFLYHQHETPDPEEVPPTELPPRSATLDGIKWLPRIIRKATCFLEGGLCNDIMYCCGGDRNFLRQFGIHPADFLRAVWGAKSDEQKMLAFVREAEARL